jgi:prepilin-type N-terminal cleavage/methylation domain-containing protein
LRKVRAFTLIELLVVVGIIGLMLGIMMPSLREARRLSKRTVCQKNLEQIGVAMQAYVQGNSDTFPYACRLPSWASNPDAPPGPGGRPLAPLHEVLKKELGRRSRVFECPADQNTMSRPGDPGVDPGEEIPTPRYYDHEGTSYEWESKLNGERLSFKWVRIYATVGSSGDQRRAVKKFEIAQVPRNTMWMLYDFESFHGGKAVIGSQNILYTDLHVSSDKWQTEKKTGKAL